MVAPAPRALRALRVAALLAGAASAGACSGGTRTPATTATAASKGAPLPHRRGFSVTYRAAANAFVIVDEVSGWHPDKHDPAVRAAWKARFGIDEVEATALAAWGAARRRTWVEEGAGGAILLGRSKPLDRVAAAFLAEDGLDAALARAASVVGAEDAAILRATFAALRPKLDVVLAESRAFTRSAEELQRRLDAPAVADFVSEVARFYRAGDVPPLTVTFAWWPLEDSSSASVTGDVLLLRYEPVHGAALAGADVDVPVHEAVHFVSARQPEAQKAALSEAFAKKCGDLPPIAPARLLEEPLAVAHQKMFLARVEPKRFDRERGWYGDPWVSVMAKAIYEPVVQAHAEGRALDERLALAAGRACREVASIPKSISR